MSAAEIIGSICAGATVLGTILGFVMRATVAPLKVVIQNNTDALRENRDALKDHACKLEDHEVRITKVETRYEVEDRIEDRGGDS